MAPNRESGDPPLPPLNQPTDTIQVVQQPANTMSQLTDPSILSVSPIRTLLDPANHGIPGDFSVISQTVGLGVPYGNFCECLSLNELVITPIFCQFENSEYARLQF